MAAPDCLAVEDTPTGAAAALAAGCRLLAVPSVPGIELGPRTVLVTSLTEADLADTARLTRPLYRPAVLPRRGVAPTGGPRGGGRTR
ncbi:hypothetical protein SMICM304S_00644 [Streptomyces microflavus]